MLTLIPTLTLLSLLTITVAVKRRSSRFRQTSPQNHPDDAILVNTLHHGLLLAISLL